MSTDLVRSFARAIQTTDGLAEPALVIARLDYPRLDATPYLARLDEMGVTTRRRLGGPGGASVRRAGGRRSRLSTVTSSTKSASAATPTPRPTRATAS